MKYLNEKEAAVVINRASQTLRIWRVRGIGPAYYKDPGGRISYKEEDLSAWMESGTYVRQDLLR